MDATISKTMMTPTSAVDAGNSPPAPKPPPLVNLAFNPFSTRFLASTATGLHVFSCFNSFHKIISRDVVDAEVSSNNNGGWKVVMADIYNETFAAVVFRRPKDNNNSNGKTEFTDKICFWVVPNGRIYPMGKDLPFDVVTGIRLTGEHMVVAGEERTALYEIPHHGSPPKKVKVVETAANPLGLAAVAQSASPFVMVSPHKMKGVLQIHRLGLAEEHVCVRAHCSAVAAFALSDDGRLLATAGKKGTLVRIFNTSDGKLLQELRRGVDRADIYSIVFSTDSKWLAVSSNKGTVHVFHTNIELESSSKESNQDATEAPAAKAANQGYVSYMKGYFFPKYFKPQKSLAQFHLPEGKIYLVVFGTRPNTILIIGMDGRFYRCQFDPIEPGDMRQLEYRNFLYM
uniref:Anaphase-promoting complex subunit 4 WD40 domain-containing protein n=1 Tax=Leersia perrieri TaxID=77586 RepID=A0A0D9WX94_9ORYZ